MDEDVQSDDSSGSESELQQRVKELQTTIEDDPYQYDNHVELIRLLRQLGDLDGARKARNAMSDTFPLTEGMWLEWIRDELPLVSVPEASMELRQLFEKATQDYLSVKIWLEYVQFSIDQMSVMSEGVAFPRDVCERGIVNCGLHVTKAGDLWDLYRGFEIAMLKSLQDMQKNSPEDNDLKQQVEAQFERVDKLFKRQLAVPLIGMKDTMTQYIEFSDEVISENSLPSHTRALKRLETLLPFENKLASSTPPSLMDYQSYLAHSRKMDEDPMFTNTLYQRAVTDHCLNVDLWKDYLTYLNSTFSKVSSVLIPPHQQAVRNCPWVHELWVSYGLSLERVEADVLQTVAIFEKGLAGNNLSSAKDSLQLWTAYLDYLRRRVRIHDNQEEDNPDLVGLRKTFKRARDTLETDYGRHGDPTDSLACYQARLESHCYDNLEESRFLWDDIMSRHGREAKYWIEYANMERNYGDPEQCRKILHRAVNSASDDPEVVIETLLQFEREEGDLESYEASLEKCASQLKRLAERTERAAEKQLQQDGKKQGKKAGKKSSVTMDTGGKHKSPRQQNQQKQKNVGDKRKRVQKAHMFFDDDEDDNDEENELKSKKIKMDNSEIVSSDVSMPTDSLSRQQPKATSEGDQITMETTPVTTKTKRSIPEPPGRPMKPGSNDGGGGREGEREEGGYERQKGNEKKTVFVSNLKMSVTKEEVEEKFSQCGLIVEVRLVKTQTRGRANAFAYVEFSSQKSVQKALELEHTELKGRIVFVSILRDKDSAITPAKPTSFQGNNKATVFVTNLQHNTDEAILKNLFQKCGEVKEVRLVRNRDGRPKGFAYVEFINESSAGAAVLQYDNHLLGLKRLQVAISNPPKRKGDGQSSNRTEGQGGPFQSRTSHFKQGRPNRDDGGFVRPSFIPARVKAQHEQSDAPKKKANIGLVPRVLAKQSGGTEGERREGGGEEGREGGKGGEAMETLLTSEPSAQKLSNDDFRNLLKK